MKYYTYIISNHSNSVLYTGITNNIKRRIFEHKTGKIKSSFAKNTNYTNYFGFKNLTLL